MECDGVQVLVASPGICSAGTLITYHIHTFDLHELVRSWRWQCLRSPLASSWSSVPQPPKHMLHNTGQVHDTLGSVLASDGQENE
jgi:hypothetical protein